jgi:hypothetical protein
MDELLVCDVVSYLKPYNTEIAMAEGVGSEPTVACTTPVFKT